MTPGSRRRIGALQVPILKQGPYLIATVQSALTDADMMQLRDALVAQVGRCKTSPTWRGCVAPRP